MKTKFTALLILAALGICVPAVADSTTYGKVLFRVNTGGTGKNSIDTSSVSWLADNLGSPCPYYDAAANGNKIFATADSVAFDASVPLSTPYSIFKSERALDKWDLPALEYNFPVAAGQQVEIRLYFAEIYFTTADTRIFDIVIENNEVLNDYDIYAESGHDVGVMKKFIVTSDGNIDLDLRRVKQQPKINGIEIIEVSDSEVAGLFSRKENLSINAYPNPFTEEFKIDLENIEAQHVKVMDMYGREVSTAGEISGSKEITINLEDAPKGVYFIQVEDNRQGTGMIRMIKE